MTSGYWQVPLAESSKRFTAFTCFLGIFEWNRAPMGATGVGGHFHQCIAFIVLIGLIHVILESYLDDILVYAQTEEEFGTRLRDVLTRFKTKRITFNPEKVILSDDGIEFLGHEIFKDGISFSKHKLNGVSEFPVPLTMEARKQCIGLTNYFRDHVQNHSDKASVLQNMLPNYTRALRSKVLVWSETQKEAFYNLRNAISQCPKSANS